MVNEHYCRRILPFIRRRLFYWSKMTEPKAREATGNCVHIWGEKQERNMASAEVVDLNSSENDNEKRRTFENGIDMDMQLDTALRNAIIQGLSSDDPMRQLEACEKLIFPKYDAPLPSLLFSLLDGVIEANLVPKLLRLLNADETPYLPVAAAWVVATLARTDPKLVVDKGGIAKVVELVQRQKSEQQPTTSTLSSLTLFLSKQLKSMCYVPKNVRVSEDRMKLLEPLLVLFMTIEENEIEAMWNICWSLYYLTKSGDENVIDKCSGSGIIPKLVQIVGQSVSRNDQRLLQPCLNVVGNVISSAIDDHTDEVIAAGMLPHLKHLSLETRWTGEVNWIVSNIAAGNLAQKEELYRHGFFPLILDVLRSSSNADVNLAGPKEAIYTVINILDKGTEIHKRFFQENGTLRLLAALLHVAPEVLSPTVDAVHLFVRSFITDGIQDLQNDLNDSGVLLELSKYQDEENEDIFDRVGYILDVGNNNVHWVA